MMDAALMDPQAKSRLSHWQAAWVIARRDFVAILFSRSFLFFLLGPLFPAIVFALSGGIGAAAVERGNDTRIALQMPSEDIQQLLAAHHRIERELGYNAIPHFTIYDPGKGAQPIDIPALLADPSGRTGATLTGTLENPVLTGTQARVNAWRGILAVQLSMARNETDVSYPALQTQINDVSGAKTKSQRRNTAQISITLLFLLTMLLAGMVLSNLVEEKANKIIEILAAALPMQAVFLGKLLAMLAVSLVGIAVWASALGAVLLLAGDFGGIKQLIMGLSEPGVGWPLFILLFIINFSMGYLLLGSVFLAIGALASTVREVQTLSMPVTMLQLFIFFFTQIAIVGGWSVVDMIAVLFPFSSPFAMTAMAARSDLIWPHLAAFIYQAIWVLLFIKWGSTLFRKRVMKSGSGGHAKVKRSWLDRLRGRKAYA
ncbi:ABC transporter permease [Altererythrobacter sp. GH1-8]|uniref:ABC transporter permease n=1 Tax=Altererythrobacter sp. GH1-8 TaxID=3349333 RepID=UPI00374CDD7F